MTTFKQSRKSLKSYFDWRKGRVRPVVKRLERLRKLEGLNILEVGCGVGSLLSLLLAKKAIVTGTEANADSLAKAKRFLGKRKNLTLQPATGEKLKFKNNCFDVVILFDVIEHVRRPLPMLSECLRVLKSGGILYVEFTPYYSITGHHLYDVTKLPIHILPKKMIKRIIYQVKPAGIFKPEEYWQDFLSLNKLRISDFQKAVKGMKVVDEKYIFKYPDLIEVNLKFLKHLGRFKDFLTISFEGIYQKK